MSPYVAAWERFAGRPYRGTVAKAGDVRETVREAQDALCRAHLCRTRQRVNDSFRATARPIQPEPSLGEECLRACGPMLALRENTLTYDGRTYSLGNLKAMAYGDGQTALLVLKNADAHALRALLYHDIPAMWRRSGV